MKFADLFPVSAPVRRAVLAGLALVLVGGTTVAFWQHRELARAERTLKSRRTELAHLRAVQPALGEASAARLTGELAAARTELAHRIARLAPPPAAAGDDCFVMLAEATARWRALAVAAGVKLAPHERFGFSEFAHEPPTEAAQPQVARDVTLVDDVLARLAEAGIRELGAIERGAAADPASAPSGNSPPAVPPDTGEPSDPFAEPARSTVRVSFTAETETLRRVLNRFGDQTTGTRVLAVAVTPAAAAPSSVPLPPPDAVPLRRVTLTLERRFAPVGVAVALDPEATAVAGEFGPPTEPWPAGSGNARLFGETPADGFRAATANGSVPTSAACSLRLVRVEPRPGRVELLGRSEVCGEPRALLRDRVTGEIAVLGIGERSAVLSVELLEVSAAGWGDAPRALARDLRSGGELRLGEWPPEPTIERQAVLRAATASRARAEVVATLGEHVRDGAAEYRVVAIHAAPPAVELRPTVPDGNLPPATIRLELTP